MTQACDGIVGRELPDTNFFQQLADGIGVQGSDLF
jgi:hypothetical protein